MRRPEFGNIFRLHRAVLTQKTVDGELRFFENPNFAVAESFSVQFTNLKKADADYFKAFFVARAGEEFILRDHENRRWQGVITSDALRINYGKNPDCQISLGFDFHGKIVG